VSITAVVELPSPVLGSLSPSRASDFKSCPLLYRFRAIDRLAEPPSPAAVRGTLVHSVLEQLFDLPPAARTLAAAEALVGPEWDRLADAAPEIAAMFDGPDGQDTKGETAGEDLTSWLESARPLLKTYFELEDPTRLEPAEREQLVEVLLPSGLRLRGFVDRLDIAPGGQIRVVDYKTGAAPREAFEGKALFQLKFYALVIWRTRGVVPSELRLLYLGDGDLLTYTPEAAELARFERILEALWAAIDRATQSADFRPSPGPLCGWCRHQALCPSFGGTPPPMPAVAPVGDDTSCAPTVPAASGLAAVADD